MSGKSVVTLQWLKRSRTVGSFVHELLNSDESVRRIQRNVAKYGKSFRNLTCCIFMQNVEKKRELIRILRDGGANVHDWTIRDLSSRPTVEITNCQKIFIELEVLGRHSKNIFQV